MTVPQFLFVLFFAVPQIQEQPPNKVTALDAAKLAREISPAVVQIEGVSGSLSVVGSGFLVDAEGTIVTCLHLIKRIDRGSVRLPSGEVYDSFQVRGFDDKRDLAVIKIAGFDLPTVSLGNSNRVQVGEPTLVLGSPLGLEGTVTSGIISAIRDLAIGTKVFQTDAAVSPGNSGGPMINSLGEVVGVIGFKVKDGENLNFAIPINYARGLLSDSLPSPLSLQELSSRLPVEEESVDAVEQVKDPATIVTEAKTICVLQESGNPEFIGAVHKELVAWNRYTILTSKRNADLLLDIAPTAEANLVWGKGAKATAFLRSRSGVLLWSATKGGDWSMAGYSPPRVGRALAKELISFVNKTVVKPKAKASPSAR